MTIPDQFVELEAQDWCNETNFVEKSPVGDFHKTFAHFKRDLINSFKTIEGNAKDAFIRQYALKCRDYYLSQQGNKLLHTAYKRRKKAVKLQDEIDRKKALARMQGYANGVELSLIGAQEYGQELKSSTINRAEESRTGVSHLKLCTLLQLL